MLLQTHFGNVKMIQVLHRAFDILEFLADDPDRPMGLGRIAGALKLNQGTCANILKTMVQRGFVDQSAPKKGYTLGPTAHALVRNRPYRRDLVQAAEPPMTRLAGEVRETVLISALHRHRRLILCQVEGNRDLQVRSDVVTSDDVYQTMTGRLMLAHLSAEELEAFLAAHGLPGRAWPEAGTKAKLERALAQIRKQGKAMTIGPEVAAVAYPILEDDAGIAALGLFLPRFRFRGEHRKKILAGMKATVAEITRQLMKGKRS